MNSSPQKIPPGADRAFIGGHFHRLWRDGTRFLSELSAKGDVTSFRMFDQRIFFLNHPELIRDLLIKSNSKFVKGRALQSSKILLGDGLLTSEGAYHLRQRRMIQPAFHRKKIEGYARSMTDCSLKVREKWQDGETIELDRAMMRLTLLIVGQTLFGVDVENDAEDVGQAMTDLIESFGFLLIPYSELIEKLPIPPSIRSRNARAKLDSLIYKFIKERREGNEEKDDLLSMLLLAQDEEDGSGMTDKQIRDEALTLFIAGHETTANALTFSWYLISQNPSVEDKLHQELEEVLNGRAPDFNDVSKLKYTEAIFAESMRLYPPAWAISRIALEDHYFGEFLLPTGDVALISPFVTHRDARFWDKADQFIPERWFEKNIREAGQEFIYFPFSRGVRSCIGESFAWTEGILAIATIAQKFRLRYLPGQEFALRPLVTLRPKYSMKMRVEAL